MSLERIATVSGTGLPVPVREQYQLVPVREQYQLVPVREQYQLVPVREQ